MAAQLYAIHIVIANEKSDAITGKAHNSRKMDDYIYFNDFHCTRTLRASGAKHQKHFKFTYRLLSLFGCLTAAHNVAPVYI